MTLTGSRGRNTVVAFTIALTMFAACSSGDDGANDATAGSSDSGGAGASQEPYDITIAIATPIADIDPNAAFVALPQMVHSGNVNEGLVALDQESQVEPRLASSWERVDDTTIRFTLVENATFHDGTPFTAESVKYTWDRATGNTPEARPAALLANPLNGVADVQVVDDHTVDLVLDGSYADEDIMHRLTHVMMVPPGYTASDEPIGTGPYEVDSVSPDQLVLVKRDDYWGGELPTAPEKVTIVSRPEVATRIAALQTGEVDLALRIPWELADQLPDYEETQFDRVKEITINPELDPKIREAISLAIDAEAMADLYVPEDHREIAHCQAFPEELYPEVWNADLEAQAYDPDRARDLLEEAGAEGMPLRVVHTLDQDVGDQNYATLLIEQLNEVGFDAQLDEVDGATWLEQRFVAEVAFEEDSSFHSQTSVWSVLMAPPATAGNASSDEASIMDEITVARTTPGTPEERRELYAPVSQRICDLNWYKFLFYHSEPIGKVEGIDLPTMVAGYALRFEEITKTG